ncbi:MAG TPA: hydroxyisourate hydrolase [Pseudonocardia sp.]|jgi:5-hydroxyisourate hydrolase|nr:hydroxyisourate hydrolase [Pseudonocardia sp.]
MSLSTHVLDSVHGRPASGVGVAVRRVEPGGASEVIAEARTDPDGRVAALVTELGAGTYQLTFDTAGYFAATGQQGFYPEVVVTFTVADPARHHHVPLLLSPYAYSTYLGS